MKKLLLFYSILFCLNVKSQTIITIAGNGTFGYSGDGGQATLAKLGKPGGLAFDGTGNIYFADAENHCIRKIDNSGTITTIAGNGTSGYSGDAGQATNAQLYNPYGVVFDAYGNLFIADGYNNRIRKVNSVGIISTIAGNGTSGYNGDGGQGTLAELSTPSGLAIDAGGNLVIANTKSVRMLNTSGVITTIAGNGTSGFSGDGGQATVAQLYANRVAIDGAGNLYIADGGNNRLRIVNTAGVITTIAGNGTGDFSGDGGMATNAEINQPFGIAIDSYGNVYFSDDGNDRIRKINIAGMISTVVGNGTYGYSGDGGFAFASELANPYSISIDAADNLYVGDQDNERIRKVNNIHSAGVKEIIINKNQFIIYPNPSQGSFVVEPKNNTIQTLQLYDINGKLVLTKIINGKTVIDASILNDGVYNLNIVSADGIINKKLVIVK
ncbi:MAG TPA: T9SS type A sorting domain-containing protein [Bacteroidia bacterium]|jgi:sugar lactone lactonase YvrE|nr:T9SS type A sorting domain-containing protein [Bacteroidia bacterium]